MKTSARACNALPARAISRRTRKLLFDPVENNIGNPYPGCSLLTLWKGKLWSYQSNTESMSFAFTYVDHFIRTLTIKKICSDLSCHKFHGVHDSISTDSSSYQTFHYFPELMNFYWLCSLKHFKFYGYQKKLLKKIILCLKVCLISWRKISHIVLLCNHCY